MFASDRGDGFEVENQSSGFVGDLPLHISEQWNNPAHRLRGDLAIFLIVLVGKSEGLLRDQEISIERQTDNFRRMPTCLVENRKFFQSVDQASREKLDFKTIAFRLLQGDFPSERAAFPKEKNL